MKDDQKKTAVVGVLFLVMLGIGAYQFLGVGASSKPVPVATTPAEDKKAAAAAAAAKDTGPKNPQVANDLPPRDPFLAPPDDSAPVAPVAPVPAAVTPEPRRVASVLPPARQNHRRNVDISGLSTGIQPIPLTGHISGQVGGPSVHIEPTFDYTVAGIIVGAHPAAVLKDSQGNQRLISAGGEIDGDSKLVSIDRRWVEILFRGKSLRLPVGGNPIAK